MSGREAAPSGSGPAPQARVILKSLPPPGTPPRRILKAPGDSQNRPGRNWRVTVRRINDIVEGKRSITVDTSLRLACYFQPTPKFRLSLQTQYDPPMARETNLDDRVNRRPGRGIGLNAAFYGAISCPYS
jgi:addiction module HigA family antidote